MFFFFLIKSFQHNLFFFLAILLIYESQQRAIDWLNLFLAYIATIPNSSGAEDKRIQRISIKYLQEK